MWDANFHIFYRSSTGSSLNLSKAVGAPRQLVDSPVDSGKSRISCCLFSLADIMAGLGDEYCWDIVTVAAVLKFRDEREVSLTSNLG